MERQRNHRLHRTHIHIYHSVIISYFRRIQLSVLFSSSVQGKECLCILIRLPDRRQAGSLCGHHVNAVAEIRGHGSNPRTYKFHHLILHITALVHGSDDSQGNILRSYSRRRLSVQIDGYHSRIIHIIGVTQKLLNQFSAAFPDCHGSQSAIAGMAVRTQNHLTAAGHHLPHILVNNSNMRRYEDPAVLFTGRQTEHMIILIDGTSHRTQRVMAVSQHIGQREALHPGCLCRLNNPHKGNVMTRHRIETDPQLLHVPGGIMRFQNRIGNRPLPRRLLVCFLTRQGYYLCRFTFRHQLGSVYQKCTALIQFYHIDFPPQ